MDDENIGALAEEVLKYLTAHPDAADSAEGILRWWLPQGGEDTSPERLQRALDLLVKRRLIVERRMADGRHVYSRASHTDNGRPLN